MSERAWRVRAGATLAAGMIAAFVQGGCSPQERVTSYKPFFTGVGGAEFGGQAPVDPLSGRRDPTVTPPEFKTIIEHDNGTKTYLTPSPAILLAHVEALLDEGTPEADKALLEQLIDEKTKDHYRTHGADPAEYITYLHQNRKQIAKTFARMPMAEHTPTVIVEQPGDRQWVLHLTGQASEGVKFREVWVRQDMGMWRLEWLR
jgi:hypothetical protein